MSLTVEQPLFIGAGTIAPERAACCSFRYDTGSIGFSPALYRRLDINDRRRVSFIRYRGGLYITRNDHPDHSFWVNVSSSPKKPLHSISIYAKPFVREIMQEWGNGPGDIVKIPVVGFVTPPHEIGLSEWPYPIYRLALNLGSK